VFVPNIPIENVLHPTIQMRPFGAASFEFDLVHTLNADTIRRMLCAGYHQLPLFFQQLTADTYIF
jgi:hypothetical protein